MKTFVFWLCSLFLVVVHSSPSSSIPTSETPTILPTVLPTATKTVSPTASKTAEPTIANTQKPTATKTVSPTASKTAEPTIANTQKPTEEPTYPHHQNVVLTGPYLDDTCMLPVPRSEASYPWILRDVTGICTNLDTCVELTEFFFFRSNSKWSISSKLTEAISITDGVTQYQLNVTFYMDLWEYPATCEESNRTKLPILDWEEIMEGLSDDGGYFYPYGLFKAGNNYDMVAFEFDPGADGDCVQAVNLPFSYKFMHEDCIPHALDISSEPTPQPTPEPTTQPTTTSVPTVASTEAPQQPTYPHQNVIITGPYTDDTCMLLVPESETGFPFMGICINVDTCVNTYNNIYMGGRRYDSGSYKLTEATSFTQAHGLTHQINVSYYVDYTMHELLTPGGCKNSTEWPLAAFLGEEPGVWSVGSNYKTVLLELTPGGDGDCLQSAGLPYSFKFVHEHCIPYTYDISSEPTPQPTKKHPTPSPTVFPTANNVYLQIQQDQTNDDGALSPELSCAVVGQCFEFAGGIWCMLELSPVDSSSDEMEVRAAMFSDSQCATLIPAPPNYPAPHIPGVTPEVAAVAGIKFIPGMYTDPIHYRGSPVIEVLRVSGLSLYSKLNISIVDECEVGSFLIGPQPISTLSPTSAPTSSPTLQFKYAVVYQKTHFDDDLNAVHEIIPNILDYKNCVELNECVEYLTGEVWLKAEIAPNGYDSYTYEITYFKDGLCTQKKKTHTLDNFVPGTYYDKPWSNLGLIKIELTNECPHGVNMFGRLNDDDDVTSNDESDDDVTSNDESDDDATTNDDDNGWWAPNPFSSAHESDSGGDVYESSNGHVLTFGMLLGLVSTGVIIFVKRRANLRRGYTPIESDTSTTIEITEAPRFEIEIDKELFMI